MASAKTLLKRPGTQSEASISKKLIMQQRKSLPNPFSVPNSRNPESQLKTAKLQSKSPTPLPDLPTSPRFNHTSPSPEMPKKDQSSSSCPLDDPELPAVGELEHAVGYCFCHHCNCGKHECISKSRKLLKTASSAWRTRYKQEFRPRTPEKTWCFKPEDTKLGCFAKSNDFTTTNQHFYKTFQIEKKEKPKEEVPDSNLRLDGRTNYQRDFINWKVDDAVYFGRPNLPYRGGMVKANNSTTYREVFQPHVVNIGLNRANSLNGLQSGRVFNTMGTEEYFYKTTASQFFRKETEEANMLNTRYRTKHDKADGLMAPKGHFATMYASEFTSKKIPKQLTRG
ncbi:unnamed protein product [Blepharisma stoltei]|uniref:Uncharacterized protein n=1 Tax=Blepharisma stoltei TaxID=1481888 RepID=A0AAU9IZI0_9CILI|nr:unnamed protein product [Blepharisma stoltei]